MAEMRLRLGTYFFCNLVDYQDGIVFIVKMLEVFVTVREVFYRETQSRSFNHCRFTCYLHCGHACYYRYILFRSQSGMPAATKYFH